MTNLERLPFDLGQGAIDSAARKLAELGYDVGDKPPVEGVGISPNLRMATYLALRTAEEWQRNCGPTTEQKHVAEMYALESDDNLVGLIAWRLVKQRAEAGGFNGLLISDLTKARVALDEMLARV